MTVDVAVETLFSRCRESTSSDTTARPLPGPKKGKQWTCLRSFGVHDVHRVSPPWNPEDGRIIKVIRKLLSVQGSRGYEQLDIRPEACNILQSEVWDCQHQKPVLRASAFWAVSIGRRDSGSRETTHLKANLQYSSIWMMKGCQVRQQSHIPRLPT